MGKQADLEDFERTKKAWRMALFLFSQHHFRDHNPEKCTLRPRAPNRSAPPLSRTHTTALHSMDAECAKSAQSKKTAYYLVQYAVWCTARRARSTPPPSFLHSLPPACFHASTGFRSRGANWRRSVTLSGFSSKRGQLEDSR